MRKQDPERLHSQALSPALERRIYPYVLAAGASLLAAAKPADAGVIYVNPIDQTYTNTGFSLDLNNDGAPDVTFQNPAYGSWGRALWAGAHGVVVNAAGKASALGAGQWIGPGANFGAPAAKMVYLSSYFGAVGPWANVTDRFLGLRFQIGSNTHYGWVRMDVGATTNPLAIWATVKDWAYEDRPGTGLQAGETAVIPEPGTLSLLALGAAGLALWRRRKAQAR